MKAQYLIKKFVSINSKIHTYIFLDIYTYMYIFSEITIAEDLANYVIIWQMYIPDRLYAYILIHTYKFKNIF